jgi:hypothetical protein
MASDGSVLVNLATLGAPVSLSSLLASARQMQGEIFIGVRLDQKEAAQVRRRLDDAGAEAAAEIYGQRRRRETARRRRSTTS